MSKKPSKAFADHVAPYDRAAATRVAEYDGIDPVQTYKSLLPHLPPKGATVLDVGAGSGRDALWFETLGYHVVAIEPSPAFRAVIADKAQRGAGRIQVRDGMLPDLSTLKKSEAFDLIVLGAVWQHVPPKSRKDAFNKMASHLKPGGVIYLSLREGPVPVDRKMYRVSAAAATRMARAQGLSVVALENGEAADLLRRGGVRWTSFAARKPR